MNGRIKLILAASLLAISASSAFAQGVPVAAPVQQAGAQPKLTPEQREAKRAEMKAKLQSMTPEQRQQFHEQRKAEWQAKYNSATPAQQAKMRERMQERQAKRQNAQPAPVK